MLTTIDKLFKLQKNSTTIKTEMLAGFSTFLTMSYIMFINPQILHLTGMDLGAVFVATCLVAALGSIFTGIVANYPIAVAPGMALNVYFTYVVVQALGLPWQTALGAVFISGLIFLALVLTPVRYWLVDSIPECLNIGIAIGIGIFIALLALKSSGVIIPSQNTFMTLGNLASLPILLFFVGFCLIVILEHLKISGSIIISIIGVTLLGILLKVAKFHGIFSMPPSVMPTLFAFDSKALLNVQGLSVILSFLLVALFDSTGTLIGLSQEKIFFDDPERKQKISRALIVDSATTVVGACVGTSSVSPFIESESGIRAGGRTGLTAITVGVLFLLALFLSPLAATIPDYAVAPALLFVGILMIKNVIHLNSDDLSDFVPSVVTALMIPCTFSIADGLGLGMISYVLIKLFTGKYKEINWMLSILSIIFVVYFIFTK
ncbi:MAG: NCS2 family permease [Gammaproteobacteria bacterium]